MTHEYKAAPGAMFNDEEAQELGEFIQQFSDENGGVNPKDLLAVAKGTILGEQLEWDDVIAANKHRLHEIYTTLGHIEVKVTAPDGSEKFYRAFHPIKISVSFADDEPEPEPIILSVYLPLHDILEDPAKRKQQAQALLNRLRYYRKSNKEFKELSAIWEAIDQTVL